MLKYAPYLACHVLISRMKRFSMRSCESKPWISWKPVNTDIYLGGSIVAHHLYKNTVQHIKWMCMYVLSFFG